MSAPALFDLAEPDVVPVKGKPWPWPTPAGFTTLSYDHCTAFSRAWAYCARDRGHRGPHAECNAAGKVSAVWRSA